MTCILVVEDEGEVREMLVEFLRDEGFEIIEATTADAAVPGRLDGIKLACAARQAHPGIPVIFISGRPTMLEDAHALENPAAFLQKPFSFDTLLGNVRRLAGVVHEIA
jgi:DNA-binding response OmpR family regulator